MNMQDSNSGPSPDEPIVRPGEGLFKCEASERVVLVLAGPTVRILATRFFAKKKRTRPYPARVWRLKRKTADRSVRAPIEIDLVGPCMGAPVAAMVLEQLIAGGAKQIIAIGMAGSLHPSLRIGDLALIKDSISDEGTSKDYFPEQNPPVASARLLEAAASELGRRHKKISACTGLCTDAFFRETGQKLDRFRNQGARVVEMELSALYTIAHFRKVELLGMVIISDEHFGEKWHSGFRSPLILVNLLLAGEIALAVLSK